MVDIERVSEVALTIITYSGLAKSAYIQAMRSFADLNAFNLKVEEGDEAFTTAHGAHAELLSLEMDKREPQISLLLAHAEDQLMSAETIKTLALEIFNIINAVRMERK